MVTEPEQEALPCLPAPGMGRGVGGETGADRGTSALTEVYSANRASEPQSKEPGKALVRSKLAQICLRVQCTHCKRDR